MNKKIESVNIPHHCKCGVIFESPMKNYGSKYKPSWLYDNEDCGSKCPTCGYIKNLPVVDFKAN